ncbi:MAG: DUF98 domain-containing protein [Leptolyngbya sp. SIO1D8]|nr:DUF98 domain-containing protein [Leptolyngbya sp. SIO1D8]
MRSDLQQSLDQSHVDPSNLSAFQRILLTTDGTLTHILEAYLFEQIQVVKLSEKLAPLMSDLPVMGLSKGTEVIARRVLLRGKISRRNYIYAESIIVPERLEQSFRDELIKTKTPIGKVWFEHRTETFKEIISSGREPAKVLANYFDIAPEENLLFRAYSVFSSRQPIMLITEKFPETYFQKSV